MFKQSGSFMDRDNYQCQKILKETSFTQNKGITTTSR